MKDLRVGAGESPEQEARKRAQIVQEYEDGLKHKFMVPPHGILPVNKECAYPIVIGDVQSTECEGVGPKAGAYHFQSILLSLRKTLNHCS